MAFNPILDEAPGTFYDYPVQTDFRQGLRFFKAVADKSLSDEEKNRVILAVFFGKDEDGFIVQPEPRNEIWDFINWYISGGEDKKGSSGKRVFDFNEDSGRIYAAFLQTYRIDLSDEKVKMHWWKFLALFNALPEDTMLMKVIDLRGKKAPKYADNEYKNDLRKAQRQFALENGGDDAASLGAVMKSWAGV